MMQCIGNPEAPGSLSYYQVTLPVFHHHVSTHYYMILPNTKFIETVVTHVLVQDALHLSCVE